MARCGKNAGRVSLVGSRRCARETNGSPESGSASGHQRVRDATHHFALVLVADGDVGVLHGHVLLHELALRLGLVGSLGGGLGDRRDDDGAARLDGLAPGAEASLWMTRWTGGRGVRLGFEACAERRLRASRSAGEIVPSGSASTPSRAPANARGGRREGCAPGRQGPERPWQTWRTCYDVRNLTRRGVRASARREVGLVWRVCPSTATATDKSRRAEGGEERSHPKPGEGSAHRVSYGRSVTVFATTCGDVARSTRLKIFSRRARRRARRAGDRAVAENLLARRAIGGRGATRTTRTVHYGASHRPRGGERGSLNDLATRAAELRGAARRAVDRLTEKSNNAVHGALDAKPRAVTISRAHNPLRHGTSPP